MDDLFHSNTNDESFSSRSFDELSLPQAGLRYYPQLFSTVEARSLFDDLYKTIVWQQERITIHGKNMDVPRLSAW